MITRIHHVQITVPKQAEAEAREFYCGVLGLPEIEKPESLKGRGGFWVQVGAAQLHISTEDGMNRLATKAHVAYEVDDIDFWQRHLKAHGIEIKESVPIPGHCRFEFRDPFGNRVEMIQPMCE
ncbi:MAG: VOC family protein [Chloroflexi bacterium]|nr:VOC family protein [Chloroflexota bacterium]